MIDNLFEGRQNNEVIATDRTTLVRTITKLSKGIEKGFGRKLSSINYTTPDDGVLKAMVKNVYEFSGAKNYSQMVELNNALRDGDKIRSYEDFKKLAQKILNDYNVRHLKAEYQHAIMSSQAAARWAKFPDGCLLQFQTAGDERVRESHAILDGIVAKKESSFWLKYYTPLDWGCRCIVIEVLNKAETDLTKIALPTLPKGFGNNVGIDGVVYSKDSSYFNGCPSEVLVDTALLIKKKK